MPGEKESHKGEKIEKIENALSIDRCTSLNLQRGLCFYLVVGLNLQQERRNHTDSFLPADVALQRQTDY